MTTYEHHDHGLPDLESAQSLEVPGVELGRNDDGNLSGGFSVGPAHVRGMTTYDHHDHDYDLPDLGSAQPSESDPVIGSVPLAGAQADITRFEAYAIIRAVDWAVEPWAVGASFENAREGGYPYPGYIPRGGLYNICGEEEDMTTLSYLDFIGLGVLSDSALVSLVGRLISGMRWAFATDGDTKAWLPFRVARGSQTYPFSEWPACETDEFPVEPIFVVSIPFRVTRPISVDTQDPHTPPYAEGRFGSLAATVPGEPHLLGFVDESQYHRICCLLDGAIQRHRDCQTSTRLPEPV